MKKLNLLVLALFAVFLVTGCSVTEKTLTCTNSDEVSGVKMDQEVVMTFKGNTVNYVKMTVSSKATSDLIKTGWDVFASTMDEQYSQKDSDGVKLTTNNDKENYVYDVVLEVDLNKASKDSLSEYGLGGIADTDSSLEEVKKSAEEDGFTCK